MVSETSSVVTPPWPSLTVTVNFSVSDSPTPSACTAGLPLASLPVTASAVSSVTAPAAWPLSVGTSLVPWMVTTTVPVVPSAVVTVKVSVRVSPTASACTRPSLLFRL
ncbi:hypothetical protein G6F56_014100 [Rhizopus delemar]|nr:hypothetical protein G6F56_014100 [Rhizopus delemar]